MTGEAEDLGHPPSPAKVEALAGFDLSAGEIARVLDLDVELLRGTLSRELESGAIKANARVTESVYRKATGEGREICNRCHLLAEDAGSLAGDPYGCTP